MPIPTEHKLLDPAHDVLSPRQRDRTLSAHGLKTLWNHWNGQRPGFTHHQSLLTGMSPEERLLIRYLEASIHSVFGALVVYFITYASFYRRMSTCGRKLPTIVMFSVILCSFSIATLDLAAETSILRLLIGKSLVYKHGDSVEMPEGLVDWRFVRSNIINIWAGIAQAIINDGVVIWRVWVLFPQRRWIVAVPIFLLLCTIATSLAFFCSTANTTGYILILEAANVTHLFTASVSFSLATNVVSTLMIGSKLWTYQASQLFMTGPLEKKSPAGRILIVLVESGIIYCIIQAGYVIMNYTLLPIPTARWIYVISVSFVATLSQLYPALVVCFVHYRHPTDLTLSSRREALISTIVLE